MPNPLRMEMRRNTSRPQRQHLDISPHQLVAQRIRERFLRRLVGMVHRFTGECWNFQSRDGGDVQDGSLLAWKHAPVQNGVCDVHRAVDVGGDHGLDVADFELGEDVWCAQGETGLFNV